MRAGLVGRPIREVVRRLGVSHTARLAGLLVLVVVVFSVLNPGVYPTLLNVQSIGYAVPEIGMLALAVAVCMACGGIDLSVVAVANLTAVTGAMVSTGQWPTPFAGSSALLAGLGCSLVVGLLCGVVNGVVIAYGHVAPILATLATMTVFAGLAVLINRGKPIYGLPDAIVDLGAEVALGIPVTFWLFVLVSAVLWLLVNRTASGLRIVLVGASSVAAAYSGLRNRRILVQTYGLSGLIAGIAGVLISARTASAAADYGSSYLLLAITIAVLGGTDATGGNAPVGGVALAAVVLPALSSGLVGVQANPYVYQIVQGIILVLALVVGGRGGERRGFADLIARASRPAADPTAERPHRAPEAAGR